MAEEIEKGAEKIELISGQKRNVNQGDVLIIFDGWLETKYEDRYHLAPIRFFLKGLINKYVYPILPEGKYKSEVTTDIRFIESEILKSLKVYRHGDEESKRISEKMKEEKIKNLYVRIRAKTGNPTPGPGANAIVKSLSREGFKILNILDVTRIPRGGPKKKGGRRGRRP